MNRRLAHAACLLLACSPLATSGCRSSDARTEAYIENMAAESRWLEEQLIARDEYIEELESRAKPKGRATRGDDEAEGVAPDDPSEGEMTPPTIRQGDEPPQVAPPTDPDLTVPKIEKGVPADPSEVLPRINNKPESVVPAVGADGGAPPLDLSADDSLITHLHINPRWTKGKDVDGVPGDDVLSVAVEPRDKYGRFVAAARPIKIAVLDPALEGEKARVAVWEFAEQDVAVALQHAGEQPMILLEGSWPKRGPRHPRLHVWARYTLADGRVLQSDQIIHVNVPGQYSMRWTPRRSDSSSQSLADVARRPREQKSEPTSERETTAEPARSSNLIPWSPDRQP